MAGADNAAISFANIDINGDVLFLGETGAAITLTDQVGNNVPVASPSGSAYLIKLGSSNGSFLWYTQMLNGNAQEKISWLQTDSSANIVVCGYFTSASVTVEDVFGMNLKTLTNAGPAAGFLLKYDSRGRLQWAIGIRWPKWRTM